MASDICGAETADGSPCQHPPSRADDKCHIHTEVTDPADVGRDPKLTRERQEAIAAMIEDGHSVTAAARANDVTKQTVMNWINRGENEDEGIYAEFFSRYTRARGEGEKQYLELIKELALEDGDHRFLASLMKQRYPDAWADTDTGVDATEITVSSDVVEVNEPTSH